MKCDEKSQKIILTNIGINIGYIWSELDQRIKVQLLVYIFSI